MIRISKPTLEKHQVAIYFMAVFAGLLAAAVAGPSAAALEAWTNPAGCVFVCHLPASADGCLGQVLTHGRFLSALLIVNFVAVPLVVLGLIHSFPPIRPFTSPCCWYCWRPKSITTPYSRT